MQENPTCDLGSKTLIKLATSGVLRNQPRYAVTASVSWARDLDPWPFYIDTVSPATCIIYIQLYELCTWCYYIRLRDFLHV